MCCCTSPAKFNVCVLPNPAGKKKAVTSQSKLDIKPDETKEKTATDQSEQTDSATMTTEEAATAPVVNETPPSHIETTPTSEDKQNEEEEDAVVIASRKPREMDSNIGFPEKAFSTSYIDNILGLLTAVLPQELTVSRSQLTV